MRLKLLSARKENTMLGLLRMAVKSAMVALFIVFVGASGVSAQDLVVTTPITISSDISYDNVIVQSGGVLTVDAVLTVLNDMTIEVIYTGDEELKSEDLVNKVGGRFKLVALMQKRLRELLEGSRPLIDDIEGRTQLEIVAQEILQDKIAIDNLVMKDRISGKQ